VPLLRRLNPRQVDWLVFATTFCLSLPAVVHAAAHHQLAIGIALLPCATAPILWRRRHPAAVLVVLLAVLAVAAVVGRSAPSNVGLLFALYAAALYGGRRLRVVSGAVVAASSVALFAVWLVTDRARLAPHLSAAVVFGAAAAWALGEATRMRLAYTRELESRTVRLERERDEQLRRAAEAERLRIARELHDVVTHHVSAIAVQAAAAGSTSDARPERALDTLGVIERTARTTLRELRALLGVLRASDDSPLAPGPSLDRVGELVAAARAAGVEVDLHVSGTPAPLDAVVELSAYRVLQEALTNIGKHAPGAHAEVQIEYRARELRIAVADDGPGLGEHNGTGYGLAGMAERLDLAGGGLNVGPAAEGGVLVEARLPIGPAPRG